MVYGCIACNNHKSTGRPVRTRLRSAVRGWTRRRVQMSVNQRVPGVYECTRRAPCKRRTAADKPQSAPSRCGQPRTRRRRHRVNKRAGCCGPNTIRHAPCVCGNCFCPAGVYISTSRRWRTSSWSCSESPTHSPLPTAQQPNNKKTVVFVLSPSPSPCTCTHVLHTCTQTHTLTHAPTHEANILTHEHTRAREHTLKLCVGKLYAIYFRQGARWCVGVAWFSGGGWVLWDENRGMCAVCGCRTVAHALAPTLTNTDTTHELKTVKMRVQYNLRGAVFAL